MICMRLFFFKQKTAYEMRISDWSSDVCSSDLSRSFCTVGKLAKFLIWVVIILAVMMVSRVLTHRNAHQKSLRKRDASGSASVSGESMVRCAHCQIYLPRSEAYMSQGKTRSEEHTSELQSLMRISYAVFCLKKKTTNTRDNNTRPK